MTIPEVIFKSIPLHWDKEKSGEKANTIRKVDQEALFDERFYLLMRFAQGKIPRLRIGLENTKNNSLFYRTITNVARYDDWIIISWRSDEV